MMSSNEELEEMIRHLQTRMVYLEGRVAILEANRYTYTPQPYMPQVPTNRCPMCGIDISKPMGYVCSATNCPTFLKVTSTTTSGTNEGWAGKRRNGYYDEDGKWVADRSR